jgi:hypothetical protein
VEKGHATVSADESTSPKFAIWAELSPNTIYVVRCVTRRLRRIAFLGAELKDGAVSEWGVETPRASPAGNRTAACQAPLEGRLCLTENAGSR